MIFMPVKNLLVKLDYSLYKNNCTLYFGKKKAITIKKKKYSLCFKLYFFKTLALGNYILNHYGQLSKKEILVRLQRL